MKDKMTKKHANEADAEILDEGEVKTELIRERDGC